MDDDLVPLVVIESDFRGPDDLFHVTGPQLSMDSDPSSLQGHVQKVFVPCSVHPQICCEKQKSGRLPAAELQGNLVAPTDQWFTTAAPDIEMEVFLTRKGCFRRRSF
ncbi:hypothetical protein NPIL_380821 [Nephila pilipes]|uniref:Uncharacterized protein n=1 Tax=Nephila pilipes TaxID=299642 RepID=A0A8X6UAW0_NEPPI|nr:hypothetical protein NPIL_380821 [Nephila pilipes]